MKVSVVFVYRGNRYGLRREEMEIYLETLLDMLSSLARQGKLESVQVWVRE